MKLSADWCFQSAALKRSVVEVAFVSTCGGMISTNDFWCWFYILIKNAQIGLDLRILYTTSLSKDIVSLYLVITWFGDEPEAHGAVVSFGSYYMVFTRRIMKWLITSVYLYAAWWPDELRGEWEAASQHCLINNMTVRKELNITFGALWTVGVLNEVMSVLCQFDRILKAD